jgi:2-amino-4-hydroxy-6-hydroxymethyldihydropteridine diphosphokinase
MCSSGATTVPPRAARRRSAAGSASRPRRVNRNWESEARSRPVGIVAAGAAPAGLGAAIKSNAKTTPNRRICATLPTMPIAYIGLGANLGDREATIRRALELLEAEGEIEVTAVSSLRETDPVGYEAQPRFLNGAAALRTTLSPRALLERMFAVERDLGRTRVGLRFGPRTIDLDLLLYGQETVDEPGLRIPHPRLHERRFVLEPLAELDGELQVPGLGSVRALLSGLN